MSKTSLSAARRAQIEKVFAEDLKSGLQPRMKRVVALMKSDSLLRSLVNSQPHIKMCSTARGTSLTNGQQ